MIRYFFSILLVLAGCSAKTLVSERARSTELNGKWKLVDIDCTDHKLGNLARESRQSLKTEKFEEILLISGKSFARDLIERPNRKSASSFCEEVDEGDLTVTDDVIVFQQEKRKSREGHGGYKCYELYHSPDNSAGYDAKFRVNNQRLSIFQNEIAVHMPGGTVEHECGGGSMLIRTYERM